MAYNEKHNEANGEDNRDGDPEQPQLELRRRGPDRRRGRRRAAATAAAQLPADAARLAWASRCCRGGDEVGRTQRGNNNAYCQDSPLSWTPWDGDQDRQAFLAFVAASPRAARVATGPAAANVPGGRRPGTTDVLWLRPDGAEMTEADWTDAERRTLGMLLDGDGILERDAHGEPITGDTLLILLNAGVEDVLFTLPARCPASGRVSSTARRLTTSRPTDPPRPGSSSTTRRPSLRLTPSGRAGPRDTLLKIG